MRAVALALLCSGCCLSVGTGEDGRTSAIGGGATVGGGNGGSGGLTAGMTAGGGQTGGVSGGACPSGSLSLVVIPDVLDFGPMLINTTAKKSVALVNCSKAPVDGITAVVAGADANLFTVIDAPSSIAADSEVIVDIGYAPLGGEARSIANVTFAGTDGEKTTVNLFGEPTGAVLTLTPNPIGCGFVPLHSTAVCCTTATNQSNVDVTISGITSFEADNLAFALATTDDATPPNPFALPLTIPGGSSAKVCFSFTPMITQQYQGQATLMTNDPSGNDPVVQMTGWGGGPQIMCTPPEAAFGGTKSGTVSTIPILCSNEGTAIPGIDLTMELSVSPGGVFTASFDQSKNPYPLGGLAPGQTAQIDVSYAPTTSSNDRETLLIQNNGGPGKTGEIPLTGQGF